MRWTKSEIKYRLKRLCNLIPSMVLCIRFPFLYPRNRFSGHHYNNWKIIEYHRKHWEEAFELRTSGEHGVDWKCEWLVKNQWIAFKIKFLDWINDYPLQVLHIFTCHTELDAMDDGWRKAFGIQICKEIKQALLRAGGIKALCRYRITQIKEKFGQLRWYDEGAPEEVHKIIQKYEYISERTCIVCGKPADYLTQGWIEPYCKEHINERDLASSLKYGEDIDWYGWKTYKSNEENTKENGEA